MDDSHQPPLLKRDWLVALVVFVLALGLYIRTLAPGILLGDSGEFQVLAKTGGLAHSTGYPIYLLLARVFTWLPFETIAWRVNLASGFFAAIAVAEVFLVGLLLTRSRLIALLGATVLAINPIFWWQAVIAEVYTVSAAMVASILLGAILWRRTGNMRPLLVAGLIGGLAIGAHHTALLLTPAILVFLIASRAKRGAWLSAVTGVIFGAAIAVGSYFYMASFDAPTTITNSIGASASAYGMQRTDFESPTSRIGFVLFTKQWQGVIASDQEGQMSKHLALYFDKAVETFGVGIVGLALLGLVAFFVRKPSWNIDRWKEGLLIAIGLAAMLAFIANYRAFDIEVFFVPSYALIAILAAVGMEAVSSGIEALASKSKSASGRRNAAKLARILVGMAVLAAASPFLRNAGDSIADERIGMIGEQMSQYPYPLAQPQMPRELAAGLVDMVEDGSLVLHSWPIIYPAYYIAQFEKGKANTEFIEALPTGTDGKMAGSLQDLVRESYGKRPIYIGLPLQELSSEFHFERVPGSVPLARLIRHADEANPH